VLEQMEMDTARGWHSQPPKLRMWKRATDFSIAAILLLILVALGLKVAGTSVFKGQPYIGADGRIFRCWHFYSETPFAIIDHTGLGALPHLLNVLNGTMSLVGPQPLSERRMRNRPNIERDAYFACRPGLTGLWQVEGRRGVRNDPRLDRRYATECSPRLDLIIIAKTLVGITRD
jgi:lipopolysaccharide/colanic/teichoic acid biosynthesis glycosyltransferase